MTEEVNLEGIGGFLDRVREYQGNDPFSSELSVTEVYKAYAEDYSEEHREVPGVIPAGKILVVGDLHLSAIFRGQHKNYQMECVDVLNKLKAMASQEGVAGLVLLGDVFGVSENHITNPAFLHMVFGVFQELNEILDGHVYSVKGNHDMGGISTFSIFVKAGLIKNPKYISLMNVSDKEALRLHLVNWGSEAEELVVTPKVKNIVLAHNIFLTTKGIQESVFSEKDVANLDNLSNLHDHSSIILAGHLHTHYPMSAVMTNTGRKVQILYPGSPTRNHERIDIVKYVVVDTSKKVPGLVTKNWDLLPSEDVFYPKEEKRPVEVNEDSAALSDILNQIRTGVPQMPVRDMISSFPDVEEESKRLALEFYDSVASAG